MRPPTRPSRLGRTPLNASPRRRASTRILSTVFLAVSVGLFVVGGLLWYQGRQAEEVIAVPTAEAGRNELIHIVLALRAEGLTVTTLSGSSVVGSRMLEGAGQPLQVDDATVYVFIYQPDAAAREIATLDVEPGDVDLENTRGDPVPVADPRLFSASNVALLVVGGDRDRDAEIAAALERLP